MPTVAPSVIEDQDCAEARLQGWRDGVAWALRLQTESRLPRTGAARAMTLAWVMGDLPEVKTKTQLARRLGCSESAARKFVGDVKLYLSKSDVLSSKVRNRPVPAYLQRLKNPNQYIL